MASSAVHLGVVCDNSSDGFIAAFRRSTGRRGICHTLFSDCRTNFIGADAFLQRRFTLGAKEYSHLYSIFSQEETKWKFKHPVAPHMGEKWEAAFKSVEFHLH